MKNSGQERKSLEEVHESVNTSTKKKGWRKVLAFLGPAYLISVGYMDPGNWATDLAGGSQFGYSLLWVLLMSNLMALLLQSLCTRLGVVRRIDLAQASREEYPKFVNFILYIFAEIAIAACDLAEVIGMAIGLELLFGLPMIWGVCITVFDSFLLLFLLNKGMRKMEAFIVSLIAVIGVSFLIEMFFAKPDLAEVASGLIPSIPDGRGLYIAIGIIGATVMPHNLYLHSSLVQTRKIKSGKKSIKQALRFNFIDSTIALNLAFFVNAAILILAAAVFYKNGRYDVAEIQDAYQLLAPFLGSNWAPILFALALIAAGQSSTLTGTLAGQIVMEGYLNLRIQPWVRRLITRLIAIAPALFTIIYFGERATGELLVLSQVVLSLQLGFAIIPLIHFVSDKNKMKGFHINWLIKIASWVISIVIIMLNGKLVYDEVTKWITSSDHPIYIWIFIVPVILGCLFLLVFITFWPLVQKRQRRQIKTHSPNHSPVKITDLKAVPAYKDIAIAVDFSEADKKSIAAALQLGGKSANYTLIHSVETAGAFIHGKHVDDYEAANDQASLVAYQEDLKAMGYAVHIELVFGTAKKAIPKIINAPDQNFDILILGSHGHQLMKDIILGTTVDSVRHKVSIPVFIV
ncbi:Nramp family divalent metal transporter [Mesonia oceanica]|uniref:Divalent metal cation transporter MntH n=1 Tax=Mesonia oceanica TaxID=2687242 RepID=A0AC61Y3H3_9FLAO|nr:Nramp family divalent metal transporter [Mesonia oceanica]MAQ41463.1 iron/manganese transporter [Mesonia sp.]VVU99000.1 Divalent metal cation transporter MntH [Mesonia oceanica]|tara:strand:+ start:9202 stop:11097 length:1896 start_codon:yes stop_codon:yes gene_type:complete